ncbi:hypothetical protein GCM10027418_32330 [Mariniluteicoccus endophyticus]
MSDWAQPFVDAGWTFDDRTETVTSPGEWQIGLDVVIDAKGRWHVRMVTHDSAGGHRRQYGFKKFHLLAEDRAAYQAFVDLLIGHGGSMTKRSRAQLVRGVAAQVNAAGGQMVWFKSPDKKVVL